GISDLSGEVDDAIQQGRLEMLLAEPMPWKLLPYGIVQWQLVVRVASCVVVGLISVVLGAHYRIVGIPMAIALVVAGTAATMVIGMLAMSVKILSKRSDPVLLVYLMVSQVLSGLYFPL